jgi:tryptophanyl-tRNA synthetase
MKKEEIVMETILTGIKATGMPHLGNYIGAIKPALQLAKQEGARPVYFIADYHGLTTVHNQEVLRKYAYGIAATWLALGLNPDEVIFYRQSDVPETFELAWILACMTPKGLMNRAHAYKAIVDQNIEANVDKDTGVNMGVYMYPILMAADVLLFQSHVVPVGKDQTQHIEIARDIAEVFNHKYGETFTLPTARIDEDTPLLVGLDGRKMSKSYGNTIPLFASKEELRKLIFKIKTDSSLPHEPKNPDISTLFQFYKHFTSQGDIENMRARFQTGIGWGEAKQEVFDALNEYLKDVREKYEMYMNNRELMDEILSDGARKAREMCNPFLSEIRKKVGC